MQIANLVPKATLGPASSCMLDTVCKLEIPRFQRSDIQILTLVLEVTPASATSYPPLVVSEAFIIVKYFGVCGPSQIQELMFLFANLSTKGFRAPR